MAQAPDILGFIRQQKQDRGSALSNLGNSVAGILQQRAQKEKAAQGQTNQLEAARLLGLSSQGGDDGEANFMKAYQLSPKFVDSYLNAQKLRRDAQAAKPKFEQGKDGLVFDPVAGVYTVDDTAATMLSEKAAAKAAEGSKLTSKDIQGINKDVTGLLKDVNMINSSAVKLSALEKSASPAAKLAAVFAFMKANDPTSVVRESEQGQVYAAQGAAKRFAGMLNGLLGEGELSETGFTDLVATANTMANSAISATNTQISSYLDVYGDTLPEDFKGRVIKRIPSLIAGLEGSEASSKKAPQGAIDYLKANPSFAGQFKDKFGYLPEGM
jgi:hypothetical protein